MDEFNEKKPLSLRAILISLFFLVLSIIFLVYSIVSNNSSVSITNYSSDKSKYDSLLTEEELESLKATIGHVASSNYGFSGKIDVSVRWSSFIRDSALKVYLVDVDQIQQTFKIKQADKFIDVFCPSLSESKYPDNYCYKYGDASDTLSMVLGDKLPYISKTKNGLNFIVRSVSDSNPRLLTIFIKKDNASDSEKQEALSAVQDFIESLGASKDLFEYDIKQEPMNGAGE